MQPPRESRIILITTILALVVLSLFALSFIAVFLIARPTATADFESVSPPALANGVTTATSPILGMRTPIRATVMPVQATDSGIPNSTTTPTVAPTPAIPTATAIEAALVPTHVTSATNGIPVGGPDTGGIASGLLRSTVLLLLGTGGIVCMTGALVLYNRRKVGRLVENMREPVDSAHDTVPLDMAALRAARRSQQITYDMLAMRTGLSVRYLAEIEHGERMPEQHDVELIRAALSDEALQ